MWTRVSKRLHKPIKIFPFGPNALEIMLYGIVAYELMDGRKTDVEWAARAQLVKEEGIWKFALYQVYLVSYSLTGLGRNSNKSRILQPCRMQSEETMQCIFGASFYNWLVSYSSSCAKIPLFLRKEVESKNP
jgi:hypothetical protein